MDFVAWVEKKANPCGGRRTWQKGKPVRRQKNLAKRQTRAAAEELGKEGVAVNIREKWCGPVDIPLFAWRWLWWRAVGVASLFRALESGGDDAGLAVGAPGRRSAERVACCDAVDRGFLQMSRPFRCRAARRSCASEVVPGGVRRRRGR